MIQTSLLLSATSEYTVTLVTDSVFSQPVDLMNNLIVNRSEVNNWGFIIFFICFFIVTNIISNSDKFLLSMFNGLFRNKDRQSMFYEAVTNENLNKLFLCFQTILMLSMIFYCYAIHKQFLSITTLTQMLLFLGKCSLVLVAFFLYKFFTYSIIGAVFFKKETVTQWNEDFFSLIGLNGI